MAFVSEEATQTKKSVQKKQSQIKSRNNRNVFILYIQYTLFIYFLVHFHSNTLNFYKQFVKRETQQQEINLICHQLNESHWFYSSTKNVRFISHCSNTEGENTANRMNEAFVIISNFIGKIGCPHRTIASLLCFMFFFELSAKL